MNNNRRSDRIERFLKTFGIEWDNLGYTKNHHEDGSEICSLEEIDTLERLYHSHLNKGLKVSDGIYYDPDTVVKLMAQSYHCGLA